MTDDTNRWMLMDEILQLPGEKPIFIWPSTCTDPQCECRVALILSTDRGRQLLEERVSSLDASLRKRRRHDQPLPHIPDLVRFPINIESGEVCWDNLYPRSLNAAEKRQIKSIARRIDGETLDAIDSLWHVKKGRITPEWALFRAKAIVLVGAQRGDHLWWRECCQSSRRDVYVLDKLEYEALELYCPDPNAPCSRVDITFWSEAAYAPYPGTVLVSGTGDMQMIPSESQHSARLRDLWMLFRARYPSYVDRFARRTAFLREVSRKFVTSEGKGFHARARRE